MFNLHGKLYTKVRLRLAAHNKYGAMDNDSSNIIQFNQIIKSRFIYSPANIIASVQLNFWATLLIAYEMV